jgi:uncharacterized protein (DUF488 family)
MRLDIQLYTNGKSNFIHGGKETKQTESLVYILAIPERLTEGRKRADVVIKIDVKRKPLVAVIIEASLTIIARDLLTKRVVLRESKR